MADREHEPRRLVYPAPTLVVGVGRVGLAVLERLGEDWYDLSRAGADPSLQNLRLLHVAAEDEAAPRWRSQEQKMAAVADYVGDSDLPSLALDLAILRSLGLVRYRDGSYQVALPRDAGVVDTTRHQEVIEASPPPSATGGGEPGDEDTGESAETAAGEAAPRDAADDVESEVDDTARAKLYRRRYFSWLELSPDPVVAAERLKRLTDRDSELDLFVTPILNRVRQGHSPRTILACVARAAALREGRDPSPWSWLWDPVDGEGSSPIERWETNEKGWLEKRFGAEHLDGAVRELGLKPDLTPPYMENHVGVPLPGWPSWVEAVNPRLAYLFRALSPEGPARRPHPPELHLRVPPPFVPGPDDTPSWLKPSLLLEQDWANTGWVTDVTAGDESSPFRIVEASPFRLGLFDHDGGASEALEGELRERLQDLGSHVHQGLIRLWVDLQRERVEEREPVLVRRRREHDEDALRQSLEILGELLVRRLFESGAVSDAEPDRPPRMADCYRTLPASPSRFLASIRMEDGDRTGGTHGDLLARRLEALGLEDAGSAVEHRRLLQRVLLEGTPEPEASDFPRDAPQDPGMRELRRLLNQEVRQLFDVETLASYRDWPTRRPPRLTVFLVGDMGEPVVRTIMRPLLREIHAELLRAFGPILEYFREGFDRGLSVTPILWMPHPADPFEGAGNDASRSEEAAIINSVHGIRRWVESVIPPTRRRVSQIFVNSRVTDVAVLDVEDAVRQTRDFLTLQIRNDLSRDEWLRRTAEGPAGDDFFSSFTCHTVEFPAEKSREYLANRLARHALRRLKTLKMEDDEPDEAPMEELLQPPRLQEDVAEARSRLVASIEPASDRIAQRVEDRGGGVERTTRWREIEAGFDRRFEDELLQQIQRDWTALSRERGDMDGLVDRLREKTSELLSKRVEEVRRHGDRLIETYAARGGVQTAIARFNLLRKKAWQKLEGADRERLDREGVARRHTVPATHRVGAARQAVLEAARKRPDERPIRFGLVLWLVLAPVLGAPLSHAVAYLLDLHRQPTLLEPLLGPGGWLVGGAVVFLAGLGGVRLYQRHLHGKLLQAIAQMAREARRVLEGTGREPKEEGAPSVRSFLESRLLLSEGLVARGFSLQVFQRVEADHQLARRLNRSVDVQASRLAHQAEDLGVRPTLAAGPEAALARHPENDDVRHLFSPRAGEPGEHLIDPIRLVDLYHHHMGEVGEEVDKLLPPILAQAGGFDDWRQSACLSDTPALLAVGRREFAALVETPLPAQHRLADEVGRRLCRFVARYYPNMGFGARFTGYEGLDPDGIFVIADAALVLHPELKAVFEQARHQPGVSRTTATMKVIDMPIRRNSAYMLSLAQGIRAHSVRNLKRFESFHGRPHLPEDRTFPISGELEGLHSINLLTDYRPLAHALHARFNGGNGGGAGAAAATSESPIPANPTDPESDDG